jgi:hypothetical protein
MSTTLRNFKNKNIATGFFGISYKNDYNHWMGWKTNPDWRKTNYKNSLYKLLIDNQNNVDHFFSTYHHSLENELLLDLNPKNFKFNDFMDGSWVYYRHCRFKELLSLFNDNYDYYIITRFDLSFNTEELLNCKIEDKKINVTSKHGYGSDTELSCDYFYMFDNSMLEQFRYFINNLPPDNGDFCYYHKLHRYENCPPFSYMIDGSYYSHNCPIWSIVR